VSLAKEHVLDVHLDDLKSDDQPASSRGAVDQYPVILDNPNPAHKNDSKTPPPNKPCGLVPDNSSLDEQPEPITPPSASNHERRFVFIPSTKADPAPDPETRRRTDALHRSKSTTQLRPEDASRGRPQVTRIKTDLGAGLEGMLTGQRRAPSPYAHAHTASILAEPFVSSPRPKDKDTLLSPMSAHQPRRPASVHPGNRTTAHDSSDSDHKPQVRRHERSRSRAARLSMSHSDRSDMEKPRRAKSTRRQSPDSRPSRDYRRHRSRGPAEGGYGTYSYTGQDHITPPQTPKPSEQIQSAVDDSKPAAQPIRSTFDDPKPAAQPAGGRQQMRRGTTDSPYTSSAEENHGRRYGSGDEKRSARSVRSRRGSRSQSEREDELRAYQAPSSRRDRDRDRDRRDDSNRGYQTSDERNRFEGPRSPVAAHKTPKDSKAMEDYFEKAFEANQSKRSRQTVPNSQHASPMASPPRSPPRTPRGEKAPRDYFEPTSQPSKSSRQRSRPPSIDDGHFKDLKPLTTLLGAATLGASLAAKAIPSLSRSSTSQSVESPSSGSLSRPSSGQRSRKPSPVSDETTPPAHPSSVPVSRTNSVTAREQTSSPRITTYAVHDERLLPRSVPHPAAHIDIPRAASRASSYSHSPEQPRPAALHRAFSSSMSLPIQQPLHLQPQQPALPSPVSPQVATPHPPPPAKSNVLPPCPRSKPVAGCHDWYTIRDMPKMYFCPSCMNHLGSSAFRDYFIPNFSTDPYQPITCSMSNPWFRFAWIRTMKQDNPTLTLLWKISTDPPPETKKCYGNQNDLRKWYHLTDPRTKKAVENFDVCSACVRNVDILFPMLQSYLFDRPSDKLAQEKICNLNISSRNLPNVLVELDRLADWRQKEQLRVKDIHNFVDIVRRMSRYRECAKDTMLATQLWHYIPELPELTICEACFEEVVWPLKDRPIAKDVARAVRPVPVLRRTQLLPGISCQLYSDRMRRLFYEACSKNDFELLKRVARYRYDMEHRLQHNHKLYEMDLKAGIDRRADIESNISFWKSIE
jgi:hypothetical protein